MEELDKLNQFRAFGLPPGPDTPNAERAAGLEFLANRRNALGTAKLKDNEGKEFGYAALSIPELDYYILVRRFPELNSKDAEIQKRAWQKFARDDASLPYRVDSSIGKRQRADGIIIR